MGILTYLLDDQDAEIVFVEATTKRSGIGSALVDAFLERATGRQHVDTARVRELIALHAPSRTHSTRPSVSAV